MNIPLIHVPSPHDAFASRCAQLNIPCWKMDGEKYVVQEPRQPERMLPWLQSAALRTRIESAIASIDDLDTRHGQTIALFDGAHVLPLLEFRASQRLAITLPLILTDAVFETTEFAEICESASLDPREVRGAIEPLVRRRHRLDQFATLLTWTYNDLTRQSQDKVTLDQFGEKLAQAYEENNLVFRLARYLNSSGSPDTQIQSVCSQLQQTLPFDWLAAYFNPDLSRIAGISRDLLVAGCLPCNQQLLSRLAHAFIQRGATDPSTRILNPTTSPLASAVGTEVVLEPITHDGQVIGALLAGNKRGPDNEASSFELQFLDAAANFLSVFHENVTRFAEQRALFMGTLKALTASIDAKDRYTHGHSERVALMASAMAAAMGMDEQTVEQYRIAGLVHDVGKIGVPEAVLRKEGPLSDTDWLEMKKHPQIGYHILKDIPLLRDVLPGVLHHHERWDGRGYPAGLAGENIPLIARVLALTDTFDAMSSNRSYRPAMPRQKVLDEIRRCAGTQFDPSLAPRFILLDFKPFDDLHAQQTTLPTNIAA